MVSQITGRVTDITGTSQGKKIIWRFRLEQEDPTGAAPKLIQVEMRTKDVTGLLNLGDMVRISKGRWKNGILYIKELLNETTSAKVRDEHEAAG
jgi:hypothetical protein